MSVSITITLLLHTGTTQISNKAYACEAFGPGPPSREGLDNSAAVFSGTVAKVQNFTVEGFGDWHLVSFEVDRYWKTLNENDYKQLIVFTAIDDGACGYNFEQGKKYLVYAIRWWHDPNSPYTGLGSSTQPIENAQEHLAFLGEGRAPTRQLSLDEQIDGVTIQPMPTGQEQETNNRLLSMVGIGSAVAGAVAFFSLRRLKRKT